MEKAIIIAYSLFAVLNVTILCYKDLKKNNEEMDHLENLTVQTIENLDRIKELERMNLRNGLLIGLAIAGAIYAINMF
jgi:hypothetical protein